MERLLKQGAQMANKKVYYQGCISPDWRTCFFMECTEKNNCPQFLEYDRQEKEPYLKERVENEKL